MPERVRVDLLDLASLGDSDQPELKTLGIDVGPGLGWEQQIVGIRPTGVRQREDVPYQQFT